jgi:acetyltransferase-like isoleucine patch superfamily enzyme
MKQSDLKIRKVLTNEKQSKIQRYQELIIGQPGLRALITYELITLLCSWIPGALGLFLRSKLYPLMLGKVGKNVIFGTNVVLRHPHKIFIGDDVVIDDNCLLDAKGVNNDGISIGNRVFLGRNSILSCKDGNICLKAGVNIGFNAEIFSSSQVTLHENVLVAAYSYFVGGGNYDVSRADVSFAEQDGMDSRGGIEIEKSVWVAAHVTVLDGVTIGHSTVIGAGAVVSKSIPSQVVAAGMPAQVIRQRAGATTTV